MQDLFAALDAVLKSGSPGETLDMLAREFSSAGRYDLLFETRGMAKRLELGLPLIQTEPSSSFPEDVRPVYEEAVIAAAREAGELYLRAENIPAGYRYLRAVGDLAPVAAAIENAEPGDDIEDVIQVAFHQGVHPAKGLEWILRRHGMCRAITEFGMRAVEKDREQCLGFLVTELHGEIVERMRRVIEEQEGTAPAGTRLPDLMEGRDWLFGEWNYYVDTSHLTSVIPYCFEVTRSEVLRLIDDLCQYGQRLSPNFAFRGQPPFENGYVGYGHYVKAVLGDEGDEHIGYFHAIAAQNEIDANGTEAAQVLVALLSRLHRYEEALDVFSKYLRDEEPMYLRCPTEMQLCSAAGNFGRLRQVARERGDVLTYAAAALMAKDAAAE